MVSNINLKIEDDLEIALKASKKAGDIIMKYYKHDYEINEKGYHNPVTTADKEADSFLKNTLLDARPDYGWLSEETIDSTSRLSKERVWIVDPLDGTLNFTRGYEMVHVTAHNLSVVSYQIRLIHHSLVPASVLTINSSSSSFPTNALAMGESIEI